MPLFDNLYRLVARGGGAQANQGPAPIDYDALLNAGMIGSGYPTAMQKAFLLTSDELASPDDGKTLPCVIMSRSPGGAGTTLIDEGYDLKGYEIKAKSCNWGPMAGFICQHPAFNKVGASKIGFNTDKLLYYINWRNQHLQPKTRAQVRLTAQEQQWIQRQTQVNRWSPQEVDRQTNILKDATIQKEASFFSPSAFIPLEISETRRLEVFGLGAPANTVFGYQPANGTIRVHTIDANKHIGVACNKNKTAAVEFMLVRDANETRWKAYFYGVYAINDAGNLYAQSQIPDALIEDPLGNLPTRDFPVAGLAAAYDQLWNGFVQHPVQRKALPANGDATFTVLQVAVNPYLAYTEADQRYLNGISGDYDLFTMWPKRPKPSAPDIDPTLALLTRTSEYEAIKAGVLRMHTLLNARGEQQFHVSPLLAPNLVIDMVPDYGELTPLENPELGNIHDLCYAVAQTFNSLNYKLLPAPNGGQRKVHGANRAFHSDEGGRPQVEEVEWPVGVFLSQAAHATLTASSVARPPGGLRQLENANVLRRAFSLEDEDYDLFAWLIAGLSANHYVSLNKGWMSELCYVAMAADERQKLRTDNQATYVGLTARQRGDIDAWLAKRDAWHANNANATANLYVRLQLFNLFVGTRSQDNAQLALQEHAFEILLLRWAGLIYLVPGTLTAVRVHMLSAPIPAPANGGN